MPAHAAAEIDEPVIVDILSGIQTLGEPGKRDAFDGLMFRLIEPEKYPGFQLYSLGEHHPTVAVLLEDDTGDMYRRITEETGETPLIIEASPHIGQRPGKYRLSATAIGEAFSRHASMDFMARHRVTIDHICLVGVPEEQQVTLTAGLPVDDMFADRIYDAFLGYADRLRRYAR